MGAQTTTDLYAMKPNSRESLLLGKQYGLDKNSYLEFCRLFVELRETAPPPYADPGCDRMFEVDKVPILVREESEVRPEKAQAVAVSEKPQDSYAHMIYRALESSDTGKLTLSEIYKWIEDTYPFYKTADPVWKNSIRHNLSLNSSFKKIPRPESSRGKGGYWAIDHASQKNKKVHHPRSTTKILSPEIAKCAIQERNQGKLVSQCK